MQIRPAETFDDLVKVARLGEKFYTEGKIPGKFDPAFFTAFWAHQFQTGVAQLFVAEEDSAVIGALGGLLYLDPNNGDKCSTELFWYVQPEFRGAGIKLLDAYEKDCQSRGVQRILMIHLTSLMPERIAKLYERRGYTPVEVHYIKQL